MDDTNLYIGCKLIKGKPMSEHQFLSEVKSQKIFSGEDSPGYLVIYPDGYRSWSPKKVFEEAYRLVSSSEFDLINNS